MKCEQIGCTRSAQWRHSSKLYLPEKYDVNDETTHYHWACDFCTSRDHEAWADRFQSRRKIEVIKHDDI